MTRATRYAAQRRRRKARKAITLDIETRSVAEHAMDRARYGSLGSALHEQIEAVMTHDDRFEILMAMRKHALPGETVILINTPSYYDVPWQAQARWDHNAVDCGIIDQATLTKLQTLMDKVLRAAIVGAKSASPYPSTEPAPHERRKTQRPRKSDGPDRDDQG